MFVLSELKHLIRLSPRGFDQPIEEQIRDELNSKLSNRVLLQAGLCLAVYDLIHVGESHVLPGDGSAHTEVIFRMVVFRPKVEEILVGRIKSCSREGVQISLGFFDEIFVGPESLQHPARFDETENVWVWEYPGEEEGQHHDLFMDPGEMVRFRVAGETFTDTGPTARPDIAPEVKVEAGEEAGPKVAPFTLTATLNEPGLGLLSWWT